MANYSSLTLSYFLKCLFFIKMACFFFFFWSVCIWGGVAIRYLCECQFLVAQAGCISVPFAFTCSREIPEIELCSFLGSRGTQLLKGHAHFIPCVPCPSSSWAWVQPLVVHGLVPPAALVPAQSPQGQQEELELPQDTVGQLWSLAEPCPGLSKVSLFSMGQVAPQLALRRWRQDWILTWLAWFDWGNFQATFMYNQILIFFPGFLVQ